MNMWDIEKQVAFVSASVERILWQLDRDPLSPTYGCAHLAYWRDKTSDVADIRRQEVMFPLALLYCNEYPYSVWKRNNKIKLSIEALLLFWNKSQYSDGSFDEWYKGERAFAAAAFSVHAVARTLEIMEDALSENIVAVSKEGLSKTAYWLVRHNDLFKTNHQAVGVAALAWAGLLLQDDVLKRDAKKKLQSIMEIQTKEGWFPEVGHMDIGYTFLTVEFVAMVMDLWSDWGYVGAFQRAFDFACEWVHPDLTIGEEYGICHNTYLSRIAIILMSKYTGRAAYLRQRLERESLGFKGFAPVLADDLRLLRWSYQPLLAYDYAKKIVSNQSISTEIIPLANPDKEDSVYDEAAMVRFSCFKCTGIFALVSGGLLRFFGTVSGESISDFGYAISHDGEYATNITYNRRLEIQKTKDGFSVTCPLAIVKKFMPPFWGRVALRLACSTATGSRVTRKLIDVFRKKKGTSINQSSTSLSSTRSPWNLKRQVTFRKDHVVVMDRINFKKKIKKEELYFLESINDSWMIRYPIIKRLPDIPDELNHLELTKVYLPGENWHLAEITAK